MPSTLGALAASSVVRALWAFFLTPVYLAVHRYIILGEVTSGYALAIEQRRFQRFFLCTLVLYAIWLLPSVPGFFGHSGVTVVAMLIVSLVCTFVSTRLIILFPAIAVDAPGTSFGNAFDDTKGYFWRIFGILVVATLPIVVAAIAIGLWLGPLSAATKLMSAVMNMPTMALGIAIASRLYLGLSDRLGQPGAGAVEIGTA